MLWLALCWLIFGIPFLIWLGNATGVRWKTDDTVFYLALMCMSFAGPVLGSFVWYSHVYHETTGYSEMKEMLEKDPSLIPMAQKFKENDGFVSNREYSLLLDAYQGNIDIVKKENFRELLGTEKRDFEKALEGS